MSFLSPVLEAKRIELLRELVPKASVIAELVNPKFPAADIRVTAARGIGSDFGTPGGRLCGRRLQGGH